MGISRYYDLRTVLSYNAVYNFIVGARGKGKTYQAKKYVIKQFLRKGDMFINLRRYKTELIGRGTFFADIAHEFPNVSFRVHGMQAQVCRGDASAKDAKWETMGYFIALSNAQAQKSVSFARVKTIIYDEFLIDKGVVRYLPDEAKAFNDFYSTVDRYQDRTKVFFLANSVSITNPYFIEYDIEPTQGGDQLIKSHGGFIITHIIEDKAFTSEVFKTRFGAFIAGTEYAKYAVDSEFSDNHSEMVDDKTPMARYRFTIETKNGVVSVWLDHVNRVWYVQDERPKNEKYWVLDAAKMGAGRFLVQKSDKTLQILRSAYGQGNVRFSSPKARNALLPIMNR